jgi:subtilisin family serine protease
MFDEPQNYIIGFNSETNIDRLIKQAHNAGIHLTKPLPSGAHHINSDTLLSVCDGVIFAKLGLIHLSADKRQVNHLFKANPHLQFIEHEETLVSLAEPEIIPAAPITETQHSWGIEQTKVAKTTLTGKGVRVAILDTGIDLNHPDFSNATISTASFIEGESARDGNGHGTHCAGIIIGPKTTPQVERYGVSPAVELYAGKVLRNSGAAHSRYVFQGIEWALENQCRVISISLGNRIRTGVSYSLSFEKAAQAAAQKGTLIIASAGNDSFRHLQRLLPVSEPANCPSIMAVGAINQEGKMYNRSNAGINMEGGTIDLVAPGVAIQSSYTKGVYYKKLSGTSMATSYVAGIAAQYIQAYPNKTPDQIRALLNQNARSMVLSSKDVGNGLVQAI